VAVDLWGATPGADSTFRGQLVIVRMKGLQTISRVCCTRCMLHSVLTHDHGIEMNDLTLSCDDSSFVD